ncbi:hypothetical protein [Mycolicibacterium moriokaense]|uniref:Uncharacterized protein n=1 Tax=Mycolicibacterium moriokaense TaxID=39691 RepID=A0A318HBG5_9MYCO|nr:hypothetical protein [Mycolicibacterium moriokaense]PXX01617.1 hypothetical protein C8E89_12711 [Mycolicibacterium moriokaense]
MGRIDARLEARDAVGGDDGYTIEIAAPDVASLVSGAGGLLFDRGRVGWKVRVVLGAVENVQPLRILACIETPCWSLQRLRREPRSSTLAIHGDLLTSNPATRDVVMKAIRRAGSEVIVFGERLPDLGESVTEVSYPLGAAARAFKRQAQHAAGAGRGRVGETEVFRRAGPPDPQFVSDGRSTPTEAVIIPASNRR